MCMEVKQMPEQNINSDLIRGHIDTIILKILRDGDNYGYEIMKAVSMNSNNESGRTERCGKGSGG